ncbi:cupin domain-containing protein [Acinetobacter rudis]|uniref:Cupin domain-containing protein n=1 Tax=Acinetobacter rudis TaxID=632955 RepID=A0AAW8J9I5_9GAMM|nr:cupin domain-containing protein [Acinetobacter rudis]MDQ8936841.1 cupin domain-containing protein [Acinetobacter rudis]MDQ9019061.1 cupin domain-containing protein [Acinetobacter rudis]
MSHTLDVLGGISAEQFLTEYWQKKPLLIRAAMPEIDGMLHPDDIHALALEEHVSARLIKQRDKDPNQWSVKSSPLSKSDFQKMPQKWTLLVQAVDQYSLELSALWKKFPFIPQWRRDDVMVSYAPQGGSVGQHFDFYDVFLVQAYGQRRWQLGQMCDENTEFVPKQPLKLLPEMQVSFDEILNPGDLLYVPPGLAHFGVAENECLTCSFGFRMPDIASMMDRLSDHYADTPQLKNPLKDVIRQQSTPIGQITTEELDYLKNVLIQQLQQTDCLDAVIATLMSEAKYPDNIPEPEELAADDLLDVIDSNYHVMLEPASRLLYIESQGQIQFFANGEAICVSAALTHLLVKIANGEILALDSHFKDEEIREDLAQLLNDAILMLLPPENDE